MQEICLQLSDSNIFSSIYIIKTFNLISDNPPNILKTTIITKLGIFQYIRMPFDLRTSAQTFQRFIDELFRGLLFCFAHIDDLIASPDIVTHKQYLPQVLTRIRYYGVQINVDRLVFGATSIDFLGHTV